MNIPSKVDTICDVLPRLPSQSELVPLKLKHKVAYRGHYLYDYIRHQKLLDALRFLKANNPLYADIDINEQWVEEAMANDEELCQYLVGQNDEIMETECEQPESNGCDSNSTANVPVSVQNEPMDCSSSDDGFSTALQWLQALASQNSFTIHNVPYDGDCMFSAISYQLQANGVCNADSIELRQKVADHCIAVTEDDNELDQFLVWFASIKGKDGYLLSIMACINMQDQRCCQERSIVMLATYQLTTKLIDVLFSTVPHLNLPPMSPAIIYIP